MYLLKLSLRPWRRSPFSQVFTSVAVGVLLFLTGFLFWMQSSLGPVVHRLHNEQVITAYLDPALKPKGEAEVMDRIRVALGAHPRAEVQLVHSEQFLKHLSGAYPSLARELENLGSDMPTVVPRYVSISGILPANTVGVVREIHGVQSAETSADRFKSVIGAFRALRWIAGLLSIGLGFALITGLLHLGRTNAYLHQDASALMKLLGASHGALRAPGLISGAMVGALGGTLAAIGWIELGVSMTRHVRSLSPVLQYMPEAHSGFAIALIAAGVLMGCVSGVLGNLLGAESVSPRNGRS